MSPFGIIVSGRMVQTNFEQIMPEQFLVTIPDADNINFIVVFLTGTELFPTGSGGQVYFSWPDPKNPPTWQKLGFLTNEKPSAIFKISTLKKLDEICDDENVYPFGEQNINHNAQIGISVEPLTNLTDGDVRQTKEGFRDFANRMVLNFVNYIASFTVTVSQIAPNTNESFVPLSTVQNWCSTFDRRMARNPNFWKV